MDAIQKLKLKSWEGVSTRLAIVGFFVWTAAIPFAQTQKIRFTGISLLVMLGAFLVFLPGKFSFRRIFKEDLALLLIFILLGISPLLDFYRWENPKPSWSILVLRLPMVFLPFIVLQFSRFWNPQWKKLAVLVLLVSTLGSIILFCSQGISFAYQTIRLGEDELKLYSPVSRPYHGFLIGISFFSVLYIFRERLNYFLVGLLIVFFSFLWLILAKLAILSLLICSFIFALFVLRNRPKILALILLGFFVVSGILFWKFSSSKAYQDLVQTGTFSFSNAPKLYVNSFNSRLILWESTVELLKKDNTWIFGLGTQNFQERLDNQVLIHNGYLFTRHLTPHNLFLSYWLQYGLLGVFTVFLLFFLLVKKAIAKKRISLFLLTLFLFFSVQTEIYMDREMGVNLFIWILVVLYSGKESRAESELANI